MSLTVNKISWIQFYHKERSRVTALYLPEHMISFLTLIPNSYPQELSNHIIILFCSVSEPFTNFSLEFYNIN